jgi:hypothetical protein
MQQFCTYGSVRGASGNRRPYRDKAPLESSALRRNPTGWLIDGAFRYTLQFEEQRLDEDSGMAGLPGVSE